VRGVNPDAQRTIELKPLENYRSPAVSRKNSVTVTLLAK
jgi:hypothetical protein